MSFIPKKAKRQKLKLAMNIYAASGGGKTHGSLMVAYGLMKAQYPELSNEEVWEKIAVIDTEHDRALYFAEREVSGVPVGEFMHISFPRPWSVDRYVEAIKSAKEYGAEVIVVDSLSHGWAKSGGLLEVHEKAGGRYQDWATVNKLEEKLHDAIFYNDVHIITTMRAKQEHSMEASDTGKMKIVKLGTKPIQRDDMEYEYMLTFHLDQNHNAKAMKDNTGLFDLESVQLTPEIGEKLYQWLEKGIDVRRIEKEQREQQLVYINTLRTEHPEIEALIQEMQSKVNNTPLEKFPKKLFDRAFHLVNQKAEGMTV